MMKSFNDKLTELLKKDLRFVDEESEELIRSEIVNEALKIDKKLIEALLSEKDIKEKFFAEIKGHWVFEINKFIEFMQDKNFLSNSYTKFKNKIGLNIDGEFLNERKEISLVWPFKDCILEGGMTKEDQKRNEIFFNEILAQDEIDRLLDPKVLTNFKRVTAKGEERVTDFKRDKDGTIRENLIIKGNNLLALHSLRKEFQGRVKLIYIDPPYNTGKDSFGYNDKFNHSAWLTFMKNRLEIAIKLLREDGSFWISLNDDESHYAKVLCDEIFGRENFIATIIWHSKYTTSNDAKFVSYQHENILFYVKNTELFTIGGLDRTEEQNKSYRNPDNDPKGPWKATPLHAKSGKPENNYLIKFPNGLSWEPPKGRYPRYSKTRLLSIFEEGGLYFNKNGGVDKKTYLSEVKQTVTPGSVWGYNEVGHTHGNNEEISNLMGKGVFSNPKGSTLIKKILKVGNVVESDIVLDYHAGSGTTAHGVLELNKNDDLNLNFILVEQMDYANAITSKRVQKVIENQKSNNSFIFCELMKFNEEAIVEIESAKTTENILKIWKEMVEHYFLNYDVDIKRFNDNQEDFKKLPLEKQKKLLVEMLNKNQLYVNLSEIEDSQFKVSNEDKELNKKFYT